jgi:hypothetical protein
MSPQQRLYAYFGGSRKEAALGLGLTTEAVRLWLMNGIPLRRAKFVEKKTQGFVTADEIFAWWKKRPA